ncbi:hypothetical protein R1flu_028283 [Riccia fluitans]|uniref:Uncharacterized protein n=1 Tax=Riccia fluitans TaxID=41844 RepID=A0ABD1XL79_9MARC
MAAVTPSTHGSGSALRARRAANAVRRPLTLDQFLQIPSSTLNLNLRGAVYETAGRCLAIGIPESGTWRDLGVSASPDA